MTFKSMRSGFNSQVSAIEVQIRDSRAKSYQVGTCDVGAQITHMGFQLRLGDAGCLKVSILTERTPRCELSWLRAEGTLQTET